MVTNAITDISFVIAIAKASSPSSAMSSSLIRSVKSMQVTGPGGGIVIVVPSLKSESKKRRDKWQLQI